MSKRILNFLKTTLCMVALMSMSNAAAQSQTITICDGTDENKYVPFYFYYLDNASTTCQVIYPASALENIKGKQITGVKFYNAGYSSTWNSQMAVSMGEVGFDRLADDNAAYISTNFTEVFNGAQSGDETMNTLEFAFATPYVYAGENLVVEVKNTVVGSTYMQVPFYGQDITDGINATYGYNNSYKYNESFLPKMTVTYEDIPEYGAKISTQNIDFSTIFTNGTSVKNFTITNSGANDLTGTIFGADAPFAIEETTLSIPSLASVTIPVTFAPTADGAYNTTLKIDLGQAGTYKVALAGNAMTAPTGYTQAFDVANKTLPEEWAGWNVKSTYSYDIYDYLYESAESHTEYFVGTEIDGTKAVTIYEDANPRREYPSQYEIYMISPMVAGNVMITARGTYSEYTSGEVKVFPATLNDDNTYTIGKEPINVTWLPAFSNQEWSNGIFTLTEATQVAVFMTYGAVSHFAADELATAPGVELAVGEKFTQNGITYIVKENKTVGISSVSNEVVECNIPETVKEQRVSYTVTSVEKDAFYWSNVTSVSLPNTVTEIGYGAFRSSPLATINLPEGLTKIGDYAFYKTNITSIDIPDGITTIGASTFAQCEKLSTIDLPAALEKIGQGAFYKTAITAIELPASCKTLSMYAFEECKQLANITLPEGIVELPMGLFQNCTALSAVTIPESVTTIMGAAFQNTGLTAINFPKNVCEIKANAFNDVALTTITVDGENETFTVIDGALYTADKRYIYLYPRVTESKRYDIVDGCVAVWGGAFYGCDVKEVTFPEGFIGIDAYAFCLSQLEKVDLPHSIEVIYEQAFAGTQLTSVVVPNGIKELDEAVFASCEKLTEVTLPAGLVSVGNRAFFQCTALTKIECQGTTPAEFDAWETYTSPFFGIDCTQVTIVCPMESVEDYKLSEWGDFFTLFEGKSFTGIADVETSDIAISTQNGAIVVALGSESTYNVSVAQLNGAVVCCADNVSGSFTTGSLIRGIYVVTVQNGKTTTTRKVVL